MIPQWINNIYIGPFWMGTPEQIEATQLAIDEECALYEDASASEEAEHQQDDDLEWLEDEYVPELDD